MLNKPTMSTEYWTLSKSLCRCCHAEGNFKSLLSLSTPCLNINKEVKIYADMIKDCFDINLVPIPGILTEVAYAICNDCITKLCDAVKFKSDVAACEKKFKEFYDKNLIKVASPILDVDVKIENTASFSDFITFDEDNNSLSDGDFDVPDLEDDTSGLKKKQKKPQSALRKVKSQIKKKLGRPKMKEETLAEGDGDKERVEPSSTDVRVKNETLESCDILSLPEEKNDISDDVTNFGDHGEENNSRIMVAVKKKPKKLQSSSRKVKSKTKRKVGRPKMKEEPLTKGDGGKEGTPPKFRLSYEDYRVDGDTFACVRCEKTYDKFYSLRFHVKTKHYKIPRYVCPYCKKEFNTPAPLTVHKLEAHNIDDRFKCNACKGIFNTKVQLRKHKNNFHMLGERYSCDLCDYESFSFEAMYKHKFKHKTSKDHHCRFCRKAFVRKTTLTLHERIHTGDRRKVCTVCGQAFVQKASLNYHMTKYHPEVNF